MAIKSIVSTLSNVGASIPDDTRSLSSGKTTEATDFPVVSDTNTDNYQAKRRRTASLRAKSSFACRSKIRAAANPHTANGQRQTQTEAGRTGDYDARQKSHQNRNRAVSAKTANEPDASETGRSRDNDDIARQNSANQNSAAAARKADAGGLYETSRQANSRRGQ